MLLDRWAEAWQVSDEIEARRDDSVVDAQQRFWDGRPIAGRRVMLRCLHGFGDAVQFLRYAPLLREQSTSLCVEAHPELLPLLRACNGVGEVMTWGPEAPAVEPPWDVQVEIMELARLFRATPDTVPASFPYLEPARLLVSEATKALQTSIQQKRSQGRLQIGVSWRSSSWNPLRSVPLGELSAALTGFDGCNFYSIQQHGAAELVGQWQNIETDLADLAVRLSMLDGVVTVDGLVAHLAGALGLPVLLLLPFAADWRWGLGAATPWYPRTRLFRQHEPGAWADPLRQMSIALRHLRER